MQSFKVALQLLTRFPVHIDKCAIDPEIHGRSLLYYPLVGLLIGLLLWLIASLLGNIFTAQLTAVVVLICWIVITGALHLDGLADSADAWLGGHGDANRTLEIMKDTHCGTAGAVALILIIVAKLAALDEILEHSNWNALWIAPVLGRTAVIALFLTTPYVRLGGLGDAVSKHLPRHQAKIVLFATVAIIILLTTNIALVLVAIIMVVALRQLMIQRIGGTTGDTAGATIEIIETCVLIGATAWL